MCGRTYAGIGLVTCLTLAGAAVGAPWAAVNLFGHPRGLVLR